MNEKLWSIHIYLEGGHYEFIHEQTDEQVRTLEENIKSNIHMKIIKSETNAITFINPKKIIKVEVY